MKTLTPTNIIAVEVPKDAKWIQTAPTHKNEANFLYWIINGNKFNTQVPVGYVFLGEVTGTEINFDIEPIVKLIKWTNNGEVYISEEPSEKINEDWYKEESFRSLLQSNGIVIREGYKYIILNKSKQNL